MSWPRSVNPQPGNICTNSSYCGIYAGNNQMIYVSSSARKVILGNMPADMVIVRYKG